MLGVVFTAPPQRHWLLVSSIEAWGEALCAHIHPGVRTDTPYMNMHPGVCTPITGEYIYALTSPYWCRYIHLYAELPLYRHRPTRTTCIRPCT